MRSRFFLSAILLALTIVIDQVSKKWAHSLSNLHFNEGFIMGLYSGLPDSIRIVVLGCFAGIVFFLYIFLLYIIPIRAKLLKFGLSVLVGGMFGNVIDKIAMGKTLDFIPFSIGHFHTIFNLADVFLWTGAGIVLFVVFGKEKLIWHENSGRSNFLIWPKEQFKVGMNFALVVFCCSLVLGLFSYSFFNTTFAPFVSDKEKLMYTYFLTYSMITLLFSTLSFLAGIVIGFKSAGPLYAFELYVDDLIQGNDRKLTLREGDNYKDLEKVADRLREYVSRHK